ncbi:hypothetical protein OM076_34105 [Solirubrobacter ginsenosidimutans]|uniref:Uncharacterized protein n=1 Tax=Solirubrobacter ginsenosidimutans TaxID=490573 RepID=A0A9X3N5P4_9ACTN|nr:hypothetical protein [Solirubrobacter ginsenosidimutans]MDA0165353.1 hypothetical protein [Solirubrobacter ginsenosidimutans]
MNPPLNATVLQVNAVLPAHPGAFPSQRTKFQWPAGEACEAAVS